MAHPPALGQLGTSVYLSLLCPRPGTLQDFPRDRNHATPREFFKGASGLSIYEKNIIVGQVQLEPERIRTQIEGNVSAMNEKKEGHTARFFRSLLPSKVKHGFRMQRMPAPLEVDPCHLEKILVVDDDPVMLKTMTMKLEAQGYSIVTATDGAEAIKRVREERPDLILLDVLFPPDVGGVPWDGISLLRWMRNLEQSSKVPVILVTSDGLRYKDRALASGAAGIFSKPVEYERLLPFMRRILEGRANNGGNENFQI